MRDVILTCAVTGNQTRPEHTPYLPITPEDIANAAIDAGKAGAAIAHIHVRDPETGDPSMDVSLYAEVVERIRASNSDILINLTTGPGQRFIPDDDDPKLAAPGTSLMPPAERVPHVEALSTAICTIDLHTMNSGDQVVMNTRRNSQTMIEKISEAGVKPEFEIFNGGDLVMAQRLFQDIEVLQPPMFSFVLGVKYGWPATLESIQLGKSLLPENAVWTAFGVGRSAFPTVAQSVLLGGHARVGLEDAIFLNKGELAQSNAQMCEKAARIIEDLGFTLASPQRAREMLGVEDGLQ